MSGIADTLKESIAEVSGVDGPGRYDIPFDQYAALPYLNSYLIGLGAKSMQHMHAGVEGTIEDEDTDSRRFGRALHCRLLEPKHYKDRFEFASTCSALLKSGPRRGDPCGKTAQYLHGDGSWFCGSHCNGDCSIPDDFVSQEVALHIEAIAGAVFEHPVIGMLRSRGGFETTIVWDHAGYRHKSRLDKLIDTQKPLVVDIKKTQFGGAHPREFRRAIYRYGYHLKAAMYLSAAKSVVGHAASQFVWVAIEEKPPYAIGVYQASRDLIAEGKEIWNRVLTDWKAAEAAGEYPGYNVGGKVLEV